jgi:glycosyltransferase involved in cell wall biosynthesis
LSAGVGLLVDCVSAGPSPTVSVITVCLNRVDTIADAIESVQRQTYPSIEHIIVDGQSTDGTLTVVDRYRSGIARVVSEPDAGIYDAMNKGIGLATGEFVATLNADDMYADEGAVAATVDRLQETGADLGYADLVVVDRQRTDRVVRYYRSNRFRPARLADGWMPPHPTVFIRRSCLQQFGVYRTDYRIAADYELLVRMLLRHGVRSTYLPRITVRMRRGGLSSRGLTSNWVISREIVRACRDNGIETSLPRVLLKYPMKLLELVTRPDQPRG